MSSRFFTKAELKSLGKREHAQIAKNLIDLGYSPKTLDHFMLSDLDRYSGTYLLGLPGQGKSGLIENLVVQDITAGRSVVFIDPHGDSIRKIIARLPEDSLERVHSIDMLDEGYPFGINLLGGETKNSIERARKVESIEHIFHTVWPETETSQFLNRYLRAGIICLMDNPGTTLLDLYSLLIDDSFRAKLLQNVHDKTVISFWNMHDGLTPSARMQRVAPLVGRFESLTMGRSIVSNIIGQTESTIDFRQGFFDCTALLVYLPIEALKGDAQLIGTMLISQFHAAVFSLADTPPEDRPDVSLFVDEFANFCTPDFSEFITKCRKFNTRTLLAHQYRAQLPKYLQDSTSACRNIICFRVTADDAREMAREFPVSDTRINPEDIIHDVVGSLVRGSAEPHTQAFVEMYLRPILRTPKKHSRIEIKHPGTRFDQWARWLGDTKALEEKPLVDDPVFELNILLHEVMKTRNANLPIPYVVAIGFSNIGNFHPDLYNAWNKDQYLSPAVKYPPYLVVRDAHGNQCWTRQPDDTKESLYCFIFFLRQTMRYLAKNPIGKKTTTSSSEVAEMLVKLPKRAAFVKAQDEIGVIFTNDASSEVAPDILQQRLEQIQEQTRSKYCKPKEKLGKEAEAANPVKSPTESLNTDWEEVSDEDSE